MNGEMKMTVKIYTLTSSTSSRRAVEFFIENNIEFEEQRMGINPMNKEQMMEVLEKTYGGIEDILSTRSKDYSILRKKGINFDDMNLTRMSELIEEYPRLLKAPIILDNNKVNVGYNDEEIRSFIPKEVRKKEMDRLLAKMDVINFPYNGYNEDIEEAL